MVLGMAEVMPLAAGQRVFRGWWVLAGIFVVLTAGSGFAFYAQGVFLDALVVEQGFSVSMAGAGTGLFFVVSGIGGYYSGGLISRFDIRAVMTIGSTVASVGILLLGRVRNEWEMFGVFVIYGAGYSMAGLVPATSLVTRWFHVRRSIALSIASTGLSVGGITVTPILSRLIQSSSLVEQAPRFAVAYWLAVVPVTLLLLRPSPEALGLRADGVAAVADVPAVAPAGVSFTAAIKTRFFRLLSAGFVLIMGAQVGALQHLFKLTKDAVDLDAANLALMVVAAVSVGARLAGGVAASRIPLLPLTTALIVVQSIGIALIGSTDQRWVILAGVFVLGTAMGNLLMLHPLILADAFGVAEYPRIYGLGSLLMVCGVGLGPFLVGLTRDLASYRMAFYLAAGLALVGLVLFRLAGRPDRSWATEPSLSDDDLAQSIESAPAPTSAPRSEAIAGAVAGVVVGQGSATDAASEPRSSNGRGSARHRVSMIAPPIDDLVDDDDLPPLRADPEPSVLHQGPPRPPDALRIDRPRLDTSTAGPTAVAEAARAPTGAANGADTPTDTGVASMADESRGRPTYAPTAWGPATGAQAAAGSAGRSGRWLGRLGAAGSFAAALAIVVWLRSRGSGSAASGRE